MDTNGGRVEMEVEALGQTPEVVELELEGKAGAVVMLLCIVWDVQRVE